MPALSGKTKSQRKKAVVEAQASIDNTTPANAEPNANDVDEPKDSTPKRGKQHEAPDAPRKPATHRATAAEAAAEAEVVHASPNPFARQQPEAAHVHRDGKKAANEPDGNDAQMEVTD